jgi:hypothetical protein
MTRSCSESRECTSWAVGPVQDSFHDHGITLANRVTFCSQGTNTEAAVDDPVRCLSHGTEPRGTTHRIAYPVTLAMISKSAS